MGVFATALWGEAEVAYDDLILDSTCTGPYS